MVTTPKKSKKTVNSKQKFTKESVLNDYKICYRSRLASNAIRREVLSGRGKFGIGGAGKELAQIALAKAFKKGDYYSGYYRDQTFAMAKGIAEVGQLFSALYGDAERDVFSGGRQMNNFFATPWIDEQGDWLNLTELDNIASGLAPLGGNITHALGLALASKKYRENPTQTNSAFCSVKGNEVSICTVGDATTSEGVFFEALNAACVMKVPFAYVIFDDGHGISVPTKYQTTKESISEILEGFRINKAGEGCYIYKVKGWDYPELCRVFEEGLTQVRTTHNPAIFHIQECTQPNGHSTSGSHERYKSKERLQWEKETDGLLKMEEWMVKKRYITKKQLAELQKELKAEVKANIKQAYKVFIDPTQIEIQKVLGIYQNLRSELGEHEAVLEVIQDLENAFNPTLSDVVKNVEWMLMLNNSIQTNNANSLNELKQWHQEKQQLVNARYKNHLYSSSHQSALNVPVVPPTYEADAPLINGFEILNKNFDQLFQKYDNLYAFGEDLGKIGGVNQAMSNLQAKFGEERIFDTGIREWTIAAQAIGMAMRGLRPIAEIQYLDYIPYALTPLMDDLASLRYRSNGQQKSPAIIRTRGHRLEGIWHSGSQIGMLLHSLRGMYVLVPRNMTQAAGMYNTLLQQNDDPALLIECLNGYRIKEKQPSNFGEFTVPLGIPEILQEGEHVTLVTYGSCVRVAQKAVDLLATQNISVELIDVQTLLPFDLNQLILESLKKTNRIVFLDEDVPGGASAYMMQEVIEKQKGFQYLDSPPRTVSAKASRPPYGNDGDYYCKPQPMDVFKTIYDLMHEAEPDNYSSH